MVESFFLPVGDGRFSASSACEGPWNPELQHGGPPAALLLREMQRLPGPSPARVSRCTVEFLGPVPVGEVHVRAEVERDGRSVQLLAGELAAGGRPVLRARAWRLRLAAGPDVGSPDRPAPPAPQDGVEGVSLFDFGYGQALEWRTVGGSSARPGPATVWARPRIPLVPGEQPTGEQVAVLAADSGSGVSWELPWNRFAFMNVDLSVSFARSPSGPWVCLDARTLMSADGTGFTRSELHDAGGWFGQAVQSLLVSDR